MKYIVRPTEQPPNYYNILTDGDAHGDGTTDDRQHILDAITAYKAGGYDGLYFPSATYLLSSTLTVPSGTVLAGEKVSALAYPVSGCEIPTSWLKGKVVYGSDSSFQDLRLGNTNYSTQNGNGAGDTTFTRCQFKGGGGTTYNAATVLIGWQYSCDHITFSDCNFERNPGSTDTSIGNNIVSMNNSATSGGVQFDYITFERCHFGVDNDGANTITPRAGIECTNKGTSPAKGYSNISVIDCVFEVSRCFAADFADEYHYSSDVIVRGNWFKGAGGGDWEYAVCLELPHDCIIEDNLIGRCAEHCIKYAYAGGGNTNNIIRNNIFKLDEDNGVTMGDAVFYLVGEGTEVYGNDVTINTNTRFIRFINASDMNVYSNTVLHKYTVASTRGWAQFTDSSNIRVAGTGEDSTRNTLETYKSADLGWEIGSGNSNITTTPNIIITA